ncbi:MAG: hypothetical protein J6D29_03305 [Solobacterium sp.]|nr:hypothetical protein [Solobacterium sp.]
MEYRLLEEKELAFSFVEAHFEDVAGATFSLQGKEQFISNLKGLEDLRFYGAFSPSLEGLLIYEEKTNQILFLYGEEESLFDLLKKDLQAARIGKVNALVTKQQFSLFEGLHFVLTEKEVQEENVQYRKLEYYIDQDALGKSVRVIVDHPYGSFHPHYPDVLLPCNYGYIEDNLWEERDLQNAYVYGVDEPIETFEGIVIGILYRKEDSHSWWIVADKMPDDKQDVIDTIGPLEQYYDTRIIWKP